MHNKPLHPTASEVLVILIVIWGNCPVAECDDWTLKLTQSEKQYHKSNRSRRYYSWVLNIKHNTTLIYYGYTRMYRQHIGQSIKCSDKRPPLINHDESTCTKYTKLFQNNHQHATVSSTTSWSFHFIFYPSVFTISDYCWSFVGHIFTYFLSTFFCGMTRIARKRAQSMFS